MNAAGPDPGAQLACREVVELITDYLEGALDPDRAAEVEAHLRLCEGCAIYLDQIRRTIAALGTVPTDTLSDAAQAALLDAFRGRTRPGPGS